MLNLFQKKLQGQKLCLTIKGMHCPSCAMNIDDAIEETHGVFRSQTSYAKNEVQIEYEPTDVTPDQLMKVIEAQGYHAAQKNDRLLL